MTRQRSERGWGDGLQPTALLWPLMNHSPASDPHFDEDYYRNNGQLGDRPALRYYTRLVRRYVSSAGPLLDFGCGTGHLVRHLGAIGATDGFEVSAYSAAQVASVAPGAGVYTTLDELPDDHYAGVVSVHVVEHLTDDQVAQALACWRRVLRPDGRALVVTPDPAGFGRALAQHAWNGFTDPTHINLKPHAEWRILFAEHGFRVLREGSDGLWNAPYRGLPKLLDAAWHSGPALTQFLSGRLFLRPGTGESAIFVLGRDD
jgi:SAM-dependent methyltransferase